MAPRSCAFFGAAISALVVSLGVPAIVSAQEQVEVTVTVKDGQKTNARSRFPLTAGNPLERA